MLKRSKALILGLMLVFSSTKFAQSEIVYNFATPSLQAISREASSALLAGVAQLFTSLRYAEMGDEAQAYNSLRDARENLSEAREKLINIKEKGGVVLVRFGSDSPQVARAAEALTKRGYPSPSNVSDLSSVGVQEIDRFLQLLKDVDFRDRSKIRDKTVNIGIYLNNLLYVGTLVSTVADNAGAK